MTRTAEITFKEFRRRYNSEDACRAELFRLRFPNGFVCPKCGCVEYYSHPDLTTLEEAQILEEIQKTQEALGEILPDYTVNFLRPPYGEQNETVCQSSPLPLILWDVDSGDWDNPQAEGIYAAVMENIQDGDIVVFHDDNPQTVKALKQMLPALKARGYQFATVSNLLRLHNTND